MNTATDSSGNVVTAIRGGITLGERLIFGVPHDFVNLPIMNLPADSIRYRLKLRHNDFARAFVKTSSGIREFFIKQTDTGLVLRHEQKRNHRADIQPTVIPSTDAPRFDAGAH